MGRPIAGAVVVAAAIAVHPRGNDPPQGSDALAHEISKESSARRGDAQLSGHASQAFVVREALDVDPATLTFHARLHPGVEATLPLDVGLAGG